jgi:hypothetical protein
VCRRSFSKLLYFDDVGTGSGANFALAAAISCDLIGGIARNRKEVLA